MLFYKLISLSLSYSTAPILQKQTATFFSAGASCRKQL